MSILILSRYGDLLGMIMSTIIICLILMSITTWQSANIYVQHGWWRFASTLPARYHNYDLYSGYKVVINEPSPYRHDRIYRTKYAGYKDNHSQEAIRNSHDSKYFVNKDHPRHNQWKKNNSHRGKNDHGMQKDHGNDRNH